MSIDNSRKGVAWSLDSTTMHPAESDFTIGTGAEGTVGEGALFDDSREPVNLKDIQPDGKYYSIVKLQIRYEKQTPGDNRWAQGSGWLISSDVLVTAGHCAFDHTYQLGRAVAIKAYVGYNGRESIGSPGVQFRHGAQVLTTFGWHQSDVNRNNDVSFIKLDKPFNNIKPFKWTPTPTTGTFTIGVVGYPADMTYKDERAARMYEMYKEVSFDLNLAQLNMLEYTISSYGGQSGSPVIVKDRNTSIGTHVYGLGLKNSASVIRGVYGNNYQSMMAAIAQMMPPSGANKGPVVVDFPATEDAFVVPEFNFLSILGTVVDVGAKLLGAGESSMEPQNGVPAAAIASAAMAYAAKRARPGETAESSLGVDTSYKDLTYNAIAGEAALDTMLKMDYDVIAKYNLTEKLKEIYKVNHPQVKDMARTIRPALLEHLASTVLNPIPVQPNSFPKVPKAPGAESSLGSQGALVDKLTAAAQGKGEPEGFVDFLKVIGGKVLKAAPTVLSVANQVLKSVQESSMESAVITSSGLQPQIESLCQRAIVADSALKVLNDLPPEFLHEEGFLDGFISTVKSIGSHVVKAMPTVIRTVEPIIHQAIQAHLNAQTAAKESSMVVGRQNVGGPAAKRPYSTAANPSKKFSFGAYIGGASQDIAVH